MKGVVASILVVGTSAHGVMYEPATRNARGQNFLQPGCPGGSCLWFNQGTSIGCPEATGGGTVFPGLPDCDNPDEPTIAYEENNLRTLNFDSPLGDWTKYRPWRKPGSAPVEDACGLAGGWFTPGTPGNGGEPPPGVPQGARGSAIPPLFKEKTVWIAGGEADVAWGVYANHGGGYSYRLCPAGEPITEACFKRHQLDFVGDKSWIQGGFGMDVDDRKEFDAITVSGDRTVPAGSQWRKNSIPSCASPPVANMISLGAYNGECTEPNFEPPFPGYFGFGGGACGSNTGEPCTPERFKEQHFTFGVVDRVHVPDLPEGDYVIGFRWESEQTPQVWNTCGDIRIVREGSGTRPFQKYEGCESCCERDGIEGTCARCKECQDDRTGDCAFCWEPLPGYNPDLVPAVQCLGFDDPATGGPTVWLPGESRTGGTSPGCTRCWKDADSCNYRGTNSSVYKAMIPQFVDKQ
jgi:hypothetical protein